MTPEDELIIDAVETAEYVYNPKIFLITADQKKNFFEMLAQKYNVAFGQTCTGDEMYKKWKKIRDIYVRCLRNLANNVTRRSQRDDKIFNRCKFLYDHVSHRNVSKVIIPNLVMPMPGMLTTEEEQEINELINSTADGKECETSHLNNEHCNAENLYEEWNVLDDDIPDVILYSKYQGSLAYEQKENVVNNCQSSEPQKKNAMDKTTVEIKDKCTKSSDLNIDSEGTSEKFFTIDDVDQNVFKQVNFDFPKKQSITNSVDGNLNNEIDLLLQKKKEYDELQVQMQHNELVRARTEVICKFLESFDSSKQLKHFLKILQVIEKFKNNKSCPSSKD